MDGPTAPSGARRRGGGTVRWASACAVVATAVGAFLPAPAAAAPPPHNTLPAGSVLSGTATLHSANGAYAAFLGPRGALVVVHRSRTVWRTPARGPAAALRLRRSGNLVLLSGHRLLWSTGTAGSHARQLVLGDRGVLTLRSAGGTVWSTQRRNVCRSEHRTGKRVEVDLSRQLGRLCSGPNQVLVTPITSGATARGDGTPTGTWQLQAKVRDTTLFPAAGGAYPVDFWMPYSGAYGMHDSSWQHFPYGSPKYRTRGSHGCVHFPHAAIAWMFGWAPIGTTVRITR